MSIPTYPPAGPPASDPFPAEGADVHTNPGGIDDHIFHQDHTAYGLHAWDAVYSLMGAQVTTGLSGWDMSAAGTWGVDEANNCVYFYANNSNRVTDHRIVGLLKLDCATDTVTRVAPQDPDLTFFNGSYNETPYIYGVEMHKGVPRYDKKGFVGTKNLRLHFNDGSNGLFYLDTPSPVSCHGELVYTGYFRDRAVSFVVENDDGTYEAVVAPDDGTWPPVLRRVTSRTDLRWTRDGASGQGTGGALFSIAGLVVDKNGDAFVSVSQYDYQSHSHTRPGFYICKVPALTDGTVLEVICQSPVAVRSAVGPTNGRGQQSNYSEVLPAMDSGAEYSIPSSVELEVGSDEIFFFACSPNDFNRGTAIVRVAKQPNSTPVVDLIKQIGPPDYWGDLFREYSPPDYYGTHGQAALDGSLIRHNGYLIATEEEKVFAVRSPDGTWKLEELDTEFGYGSDPGQAYAELGFGNSGGYGNPAHTPSGDNQYNHDFECMGPVCNGALYAYGFQYLASGLAGAPDPRNGLFTGDDASARDPATGVNPTFGTGDSIALDGSNIPAWWFSPPLKGGSLVIPYDAAQGTNGGSDFMLYKYRGFGGGSPVVRTPTDGPYQPPAVAKPGGKASDLAFE